MAHDNGKQMAFYAIATAVGALALSGCGLIDALSEPPHVTFTDPAGHVQTTLEAYDVRARAIELDTCKLISDASNPPLNLSEPYEVTLPASGTMVFRDVPVYPGTNTLSLMCISERGFGASDAASIYGMPPSAD